MKLKLRPNGRESGGTLKSRREHREPSTGCICPVVESWWRVPQPQSSPLFSVQAITYKASLSQWNLASYGLAEMNAAPCDLTMRFGQSARMKSCAFQAPRSY